MGYACVFVLWHCILKFLLISLRKFDTQSSLRNVFSSACSITSWNWNNHNKKKGFPWSALPICEFWVHAKWSLIQGNLAIATGFVCTQCHSNKATDNNNFDKVMFTGCNLWGGGQMKLSWWYVRCWSCWIKHFQESKQWLEKLQRVSTTDHHQVDIIEREKGSACSRCMQCYAVWKWNLRDQTWRHPRLHRNEMPMIHWMCGVTLRDRYSCRQLSKITAD